MRRVLWVGKDDHGSISRYEQLAEKLSPSVLIQSAGDQENQDVALPQQWDIVVLDCESGMHREGLASKHPILARVMQSNPDAVVVLVVESLDASSAAQLFLYDAVDCVLLSDGIDHLVMVLRRTLSRLKIARSVITSSIHQIEEFYVSLSIENGAGSSTSLSKYLLRQIAQMDVCDVAGQFRAIRAFEEVLAATKLFQSDAIGAIRLRVHLSRDGLRLTLRADDALGKNTTPGWFDQLWFAPKMMDEVHVNSIGGEVTMLKLSDEVCQQVAQAIAERRDTRDEKHDLLDDILQAFKRRPGE